ncbi:MAG: sodium:proline symporter, partial [Planctomycetota bacterium]|nr:sodium:proline symporter [Planctomycetota bacterium]
MELKALDWSIVGAYFVICLVIGLYFTKRASGSMSEFFLSGRSFSWWLAGTGMVATTFASDTPLAVSGLVARYGLAGNWFWWSLAMGGMVTVFVFARLWRRSEVMTDLQLTEMRYGGKPAAFLRGFRALYIVLILGMIPAAWVVGAILKVLNQTVFYGINFAAFQPGGIVGDPNTAGFLAATIEFFVQSFGATPQGALDGLLIAVLLGLTGIYSVLSGMWGLALTDFFQFWLKLPG